MIIAASSLSYRNKLNTNILEQIACARRDGFFACELHACFRGQRLSKEDIDTALKEEMTFPVHANFKDNNISSLDPVIQNASVSQIKEDILFAKAINARVVVAHPGCAETGYEEEAYDRLNRSLQELIPFAHEREIVFTLENMDGTENKLFSRHQDVKNILALHPGLKLTIDFAHLGITHQDITFFLNDFADRIAHFHISGYFPERPHPKVPLEESQIDFSPHLRRIRDWEMLIAIEISDRLGVRQSRAIIENAFGGR